MKDPNPTDRDSTSVGSKSRGWPSLSPVRVRLAAASKQWGWATYLKSPLRTTIPDTIREKPPTQDLNRERVHMGCGMSTVESRFLVIADQGGEA